MSSKLSRAGRRPWAAAFLVTFAMGTVVVVAQTPAADAHHAVTAEQGKPQTGAAMGSHQAMMAHHKQKMADQKAMMARMAVADQKLTELVAKMNAARGDDKVAAIAAVVTELAAQRMQMQQMMAMQGGMMDQMMAHMSGMHGAAGTADKKAPEPPKDAGDADHSAHHPEK